MSMSMSTNKIVLEYQYFEYFAPALQGITNMFFLDFGHQVLGTPTDGPRPLTLLTAEPADI